MATPSEKDNLTQSVGVPDGTGALPSAGVSISAGNATDSAAKMLAALRASNRYEIGNVIARGGMGAILNVREASIERIVAMKVVLDANNPTALSRFVTEAKVTGQLEHPNIVPVHELGVDDKQQVFYTMKFVRGVTLRVVLEKLAKGDAETVNEYPLAALLTILQKVCDAMAFAHSKGVIHRDLKPENIMLGKYGEVLVMDWGLAKILGQAETESRNDSTVITPNMEVMGTQTMAGAVLGTLAYMAPEQATGQIEQMDARSDIYALGGILYHILVLRSAVDGRDARTAMIQITSGGILPPERTVGPTRRLPHLPGGRIPESLSAVAMKALKLEQKDRYQSVPELQREIEAYQNGFATSAEHAGVLKQVSLLVKRNKGVFATAFAAWFVITALLAAFVLNLRENERLAKAQKLVAENNLAKAEKAEREATANLAKAEIAEKDATEQRKRADDQAEVTLRNLYHAQMHLGQQSWREHRGLPQMQALLANWLPKGEALDRRGWEWFYLNSLPYQNLRAILPSDAPSKQRVCVVAWHLPSKRLAEGTSNGVIRIWDVDREQATLTFTGPGKAGGTWWGAQWFVWSPDGSQIAAGFHDGTVHLWETVSGQKLGVLSGNKLLIYAVAFSSDGLRLAAWTYDGEIKIWALNSKRIIASISHPGKVSCGAWSPDDKLLAAGHTDGTVTLSGAKPGEKIVTLRGHSSQIHALAWNPASTRLASASYDHTVGIWDVAAEKLSFEPLRHSHEVTAVAWEPNGKRVATGSIDETVKLWDAASGREELTLRGHQDMVTSVAWGPDGRLTSGDNFGGMRTFDSTHDQESFMLPGHAVRATSVAWNPKGTRLASGGDDGQIRIWDPARRGEMLCIKGHDETKLSKQFGLIRTLAWSPEGTRLASGGLDGAAKVWDANSGDELLSLPTDHGSVWAVAWNRDGTRLAVGSNDGTIRLVEGLGPAPKVTLFQAHMGIVRGLAWSPQADRLASAGADRFVKLWDPSHGTALASMQGHQTYLLHVAWSADGKRLASSSSDHFVIVWDPEAGKKLATMSGHNDFVDSVVWSPDGTRLASAGIDNTVRLWDPNTGEETFVLRGNTGMFHDVSWHPDGAQLAAASSDGQIWIWDATRGFEHDKTARALPFVDRMISAKPASDVERLRFAQLAYDHKKFTLAAQLWAEALAKNPKLFDDIRTQHRFNAARASCLAAAGKSRDEPPLDDAAKAKLRAQALDWLNAELTGWRMLLEATTPEDRELGLMKLSGWKRDAGFAGIRDAEALAKLPATERAALTQLWTDVAAFYKSEHAASLASLQEKLTEARKTPPADSTDLAYLISRISRVNLEQEQWVEAETMLRECLSIREKALPDSWLTFNTISSLGGALLGQKKYAEAEPLLLKGYKGMKEREAAIPPAGKERLIEALERLIEFYVVTDKPDEVKRWRAEQAE